MRGLFMVVLSKYKGVHRLVMLFVMNLLTVVAFSQSYTISGFVTDANTGETMIGASVYDTITRRGVITNVYGFYSITLPKGQVALKVSYVGYASSIKELQLDSNITWNVNLTSDLVLNEVVVIGERVENKVNSTQLGAVEIPVQQIKKIPTLFGEADVLKALQLLPGVQSGTEGSAGLYVRGGGPDQNLLLLDGVPLYNVNHVCGFFSVFNPDAIKNVTLYKGNFPARFGGRLSSVVDVRMKDGDMYEYHGNIDVGLVAAKFQVEGPIVKGKTSFCVSGRRTYFDLYTVPMMYIVAKTLDDASSWGGYYFYDFNVKLNHKFSDKDRLYFSWYSGDDKVYAHYKYLDYQYDNEGYQERMKMNMNWRWGNMLSALRWNHVVGSKMFMNTSLTYTQYMHRLSMNNIFEWSEESVTSMENIYLGMRSGIKDISAKVDFDYMPNYNHKVTFGSTITHHRFNPTVMAMNYKEDVGDGVMFSIDTVSSGKGIILANEFSAFFEDDWTLTPTLKANIGVHYSAYMVQGKFYHSLQPRVSMRWLLREDLSFKIGYARMSQYVHLLSNSSISLPTDLWVPVTKNIIPMNSEQVAAGVFYELANKVEFSVEGYYKTMRNLIEYKDGATYMGLEASNWEDKVVMGDGWSYGVEFLAQKSVGNTTGWIAYTWSKTERLFDRPGQEINFGKPFPAKYDRRHDISITLSHKFSEKIDVAATWVYSTGNCATVAIESYDGIGLGYNEIGTIDYIESRNNYRFSNYHRLDLSANFNKKKKHCMRTFNISVYNAYSQRNPFLAFVSYDYAPDGSTSTIVPMIKELCIFPIIPSVGWSFKF